MFKDFLQRDIKVGDWFIISNAGRGGTLYAGKVYGFKKNRMYYLRVYANRPNSVSHTERCNECVIVSEMDVPSEWAIKAEPDYQAALKKFNNV